MVEDRLWYSVTFTCCSGGGGEKQPYEFTLMLEIPSDDSSGSPRIDATTS